MTVIGVTVLGSLIVVAANWLVVWLVGCVQAVVATMTTTIISLLTENPPTLFIPLEHIMFIAHPWEPMQGESRGIKKIKKKIITFEILVKIIFLALLPGSPPGGSIINAFQDV